MKEMDGTWKEAKSESKEKGSSSTTEGKQAHL